MTNPLNAAERRLSKVAAIKDCEFAEGLLQVYECTNFSVVYGMYETDLRSVANRRLQELDESPIDEAFARSVGEYGEHETLGGKKARYVRVAPNATIWISGYPIRLEVETARIDNPTIGDFYTAARLFKVQLKEGV